jgi:hypothetical protein
MELGMVTRPARWKLAALGDVNPAVRSILAA